MVTGPSFNNISWGTYIGEHETGLRHGLLFTRATTVFASLNALIIPVVYFFFPETAGRSLEGMYHLYCDTTSGFAELFPRYGCSVRRRVQRGRLPCGSISPERYSPCRYPRSGRDPGHHRPRRLTPGGACAEGFSVNLYLVEVDKILCILASRNVHDYSRACVMSRPGPPEARPKPRLLGRAGPCKSLVNSVRASSHRRVIGD